MFNAISKGVVAGLATITAAAVALPTTAAAQSGSAWPIVRPTGQPMPGEPMPEYRYYGPTGLPTVWPTGQTLDPSNYPYYPYAGENPRYDPRSDPGAPAADRAWGAATHCYWRAGVRFCR